MYFSRGHIILRYTATWCGSWLTEFVPVSFCSVSLVYIMLSQFAISLDSWFIELDTCYFSQGSTSRHYSKLVYHMAFFFINWISTCVFSLGATGRYYSKPVCHMTWFLIDWASTCTYIIVRVSTSWPCSLLTDVDSWVLFRGTTIRYSSKSVCHTAFF